jgi:hypothetical protein
VPSPADAPADVNFDDRVSAAAPPEMDADTYEKIYGNGDFESYFTSAQARVYVGNLFLDEVQSIQFALQNNIVPVYGYASRFADAFAEGKSLVQGQLVLNYVSPAYLFTVLEEYDRVLAVQDGKSADYKDGEALAKMIQARRASAARGWIDSSYEDRLQTLAASPEVIRAAKQKLLGEGFDPVYCNGVYIRREFDMTVEIGTGIHRTFRRLEKCRIISNEQILDQSGQVIGDAYGFIARRLR